MIRLKVIRISDLYYLHVLLSKNKISGNFNSERYVSFKVAKTVWRIFLIPIYTDPRVSLDRSLTKISNYNSIAR